MPAIFPAHSSTRRPLCRAEPRFGERVPYVVVYGEPGARLYDMVVPPRALVESGGRLRLHALYYITKNIIPALDRVLSLMGADIKVGGWVGGLAGAWPGLAWPGLAWLLSAEGGPAAGELGCWRW